MKVRLKKGLLSLIFTLAMAFSLTTEMIAVAYGADQDIVILYTNDVHCGVDDNIGYGGLALYKKPWSTRLPM